MITNKLLFIFPFVLCYCTISAQIKRTFIYNNRPVELLAQNNRMRDNFSFPGMKAFIVIGNPGKPLDSLYATDKLRQQPVKGIDDYACFYYITKNRFFNDTAIAGFLKSFIEYCYNEDFINRNSVHIVWQSEGDTIPCFAPKEINPIISSINTLVASSIAPCNTTTPVNTTIENIWLQSRFAKTTVSYPTPNMMDMGEKQTEKQKITAHVKNSGAIFLQLTGGMHNINQRYRTDFDTATLVDFAKIKTLWGLTTGYTITHWLNGFIETGVIYSGKKKNINNIDWGDSSGSGITVTGSGYAGLMFRYGAGIGLLPYRNNKLTLFITISAGRLKAVAAGGYGTKTIGGANTSIITKATESTRYLMLSTGANYNISPSVYFTGNFQYKISRFTEPIGSVKAFTGWAINVGLGFTIPTKK